MTVFASMRYPCYGPPVEWSIDFRVAPRRWYVEMFGQFNSRRSFAALANPEALDINLCLDDTSYSWSILGYIAPKDRRQKLEEACRLSWELGQCERDELVAKMNELNGRLIRLLQFAVFDSYVTQYACTSKNR